MMEIPKDIMKKKIMKTTSQKTAILLRVNLRSARRYRTSGECSTANKDERSRKHAVINGSKY